MNFGPISYQESGKPIPSRLRVAVFVSVMLIVLGIVSARLMELTVIHGAENRLRADENRIIIRPIRATRGVILDRHGVVLTRNVPTKHLIDVPGDNSGTISVEDVGRMYPYGNIFAHVVGYVGEGDKPGDIAGKTGLEKQYDSVLAGHDGAELIEVDANGKIVRTEGEELPLVGKNISTTLDLSLQQIMSKALAGSPRGEAGGRRGSAIAIDPLDGSVLGLVSSPSFDPNVFEKSDSRQSDIQTLLSDTANLPLFNRAVSGAYPPGSIFKLVTATAGLASGKVTNQTTVVDTGEIKLGTFRYGNWYFDQYHRTEGALGIVRALTRSNDIFFYKVGEWIGPNFLADWAKKFGLGKDTGVDLPGETNGLIPDPIWKERQIGERWFLGNTYHMAIGQGDVRVTPLQAALMTGVIATGKRCQPSIATSEAERHCENIEIPDTDRSTVLTGMVGACSIGGTAFPFFEFTPMVACKTGTAQQGSEKKKPHAWFTVVAPMIRTTDSSGNEHVVFDESSKKRIVLTVMLEEAGEGSAEAAPVAKEILTEWFKD